MTRPINEPELDLLRLDEQRTRLYLALPAVPVVFSARINQAFTSKTRDMCVQVTYDFDGLPAGDYTAVIPGMTVLFGSTEGGWNRGIARARLAATSTILKISEISDAFLVDNLYISVVREFSPWACQPRVLANTIKMDWGIVYSDQHTKFSPFPIWGSDRVAKLPDGETPTVTLLFDASASYCPGSTITGYSFSAPGASATSGLTTATPSITYNAAGTYIIYLTVTAANGKTTLSSHVVYIWSNAAPPLELEFDQLGGSLDSGGWTVEITLRDGFDESAIRPHAKAILFSEDWYGATAGSLGPLTGCENVVMPGWIADEGLDINPNFSSARFTLAGANYWLGRESLYPVNVKNVSGTPNKWDEIKNLTFDQFAASFLQNRTTLPNIVDCYLSGDTRRASRFEIGEGSAWEQLSSLAQAKILGLPFCDRYSRLYINVDAQYVADKGALPMVMDITKADRAANLSFGRQSVTSTALLMLSGIVFSGSAAKTLYAIAPGHTPKRLGVWAALDEIMIGTQAELNALAGDLCGTQNNEFPSIPIDLEQGNRFIDCAPAQVCHLGIPAEDNIRGIAFSGDLIPRSVEYRLAGGVLRSSVDFEAVCVREMNRTGDVPIDDSGGTIPIPPIAPTFTPPPLPPLPVPPTTLGPCPVRAAFALISTGLYYTENVNDVSPVWASMNGAAEFPDGGLVLQFGVHRWGNYLYAMKPEALQQAWFVEGAASQYGLSIVMDTTDLSNMLPVPDPPPIQMLFNRLGLGVHPYSGELLFVAGQQLIVFESQQYIFHVGSDLVVTFGEANAMGEANPITWGDGLAAVFGSDDGVWSTADSGATADFLAVAGTGGALFVVTRSGVTPNGALHFPTSAVIRITDDNYATFAVITGAYYLNPFKPIPAAINTDGTMMLGTVIKVSDGKYYFAYSTDYGATWTEIAEQLSTNNVYRAFVYVAEGLTGGIWLWGDDTKIYLSEDNGVTIRNVTGNLFSDFQHPATSRIDTRQVDFLA